MALSVIRVGEDHPKKSQLNAFGLSNYEDPLYVYLNLQTVMNPYHFLSFIGKKPFLSFKMLFCHSELAVFSNL